MYNIETKIDKDCTHEKILCMNIIAKLQNNYE